MDIVSDHIGCDKIRLAPVSKNATKVCCVDPVVKCAILGISQVMSQIERASIVVHGPKGCVFPAYEATMTDSLIFNFTEMCERTVIFGGEEQVREKILDTYYDNNPSIINVVTTCSSEIIGDDVNGIITSLGREVPLPMIRTEGIGFKRNNWEAISHVLIELVKLYTHGIKRKNIGVDGSINLICHVGASVRWKDEVHSLEKLLARFNRPIRRLVCENSIEDLHGVEKAAINVVINPDIGLEAARFMKERFGTPYLAKSVPVGLEQTVDWLVEIGKHLDVDCRAVLDETSDQVRMQFRNGLGRVANFRPLEQLQSLDTLIIGEPQIAFAYLHFLSRELDMTVSNVVLKSLDYHEFDLDNWKAKFPDTIFTCLSDNMEIKTHMGIVKPELILCNDFEYHLVKIICDPLYVNITYPGMRHVKMKPEPFLGFDGALYFTQHLLNLVIDKYN